MLSLVVSLEGTSLMKYLGEAMTIAAVLSYDRNQHCLDFCYAGHPQAMI
jgi:hypothetical protein